MTLKIRGNTSAFSPKLPYKIKLQKKSDLIQYGEGKDKNWLLLSDDLYTTLNLMIGLKVNELVGLQWTPKMKFVNLIVNDDYKGDYFLCESVERNESNRLNVSKEDGFIIEFDAFAEYEPKWFSTGITPRKYTFKYPDTDDLSDEQFEWIKNYMYLVELSMYANDFDEYIDLKSFARWLIGHDILGTGDWAGSNMYMTLFDRNSKLKMANMWDYDSIFELEDEFSRVHTHDGGWVYPRLLESSNPTFREEYLRQWNEIWLGEAIPYEVNRYN